MTPHRVRAPNGRWAPKGTERWNERVRTAREFVYVFEALASAMGRLAATRDRRVLLARRAYVLARIADSLPRSEAA